MTIYYTGVGSRKTPDTVLKRMTSFARRFSELGLILRSGGAVGADRAFERGSLDGTCEIFRAHDITDNDPVSDLALAMAADIHPAWRRCSDYAKKLHARNCLQVLGPTLNEPSEFLVCWTERGEPVGGTRTAVLLAQRHNIPVFNLALGRNDLAEFVKSAEWYDQ